MSMRCTDLTCVSHNPEAADFLDQQNGVVKTRRPLKPILSFPWAYGCPPRVSISQPPL